MIVNLAALREQRTSATQSSSEFADGDPRKLNHLSLEQQKKRAKELLHDLRMHELSALERRRRVHTGTPRQTNIEPRLSEAQFVIAREHGFPKWADFKTHIEQARIARAAVAQGAPEVLDAECRTLHIRCGSDIMHKLAVAGFAGDFLNFSDPYAHGPVPRTSTLDEFIRIRAAHIERRYHQAPVLTVLTEDYAALEQARDYEIVTLWFEHDSYDQLILAKLLHFFSDPGRRPQRLRFINVTGFPGVQRFNGLGQLPADALRVLWAQFTDVGAAQFEFAKHAWHAITAPAPELLAQLIATQTPALPVMANALHRHLQELPSLHNGLSLTEQLTLQVLSNEGPLNAARVFGSYTNRYEPLPYLGDSMYWCYLDDLAGAPHPAILLNKHGEKPNAWDVSLTPLGNALLHGTAHWLELHPVPRWVGGVHIDARRRPVWCYDGAGGAVLRQ
ncbi:MAG: DUF1835 domain-containing protein [Gammaproteobacteria bacterium]|nr:DUF1835 domain-containing protein [Gammaproteobacteria bacterium]